MMCLYSKPLVVSESVVAEMTKKGRNKRFVNKSNDPETPECCPSSHTLSPIGTVSNEALTVPGRATLLRQRRPAAT
jgi:hypothetical protein